jgi:osmoprotectant transport system ATP-binding protein
MITLEHVSKTFRSRGKLVHAVDDVSFEIAAGELCVLIGPSGSGKTTTMRMINRLELPTQGRVIVDGRDSATLDQVALRRGIGYVIQQGGLLPHFTVADNVAIVPRLLGWPKPKRKQRANELLELVGLPPAQFADRYPRQLSGGQQQRVGVARALAADPPIVLMDEPFGALDPVTRKQLQGELRRIQSEVNKTIVFVTHDINEAFLLGDRVILMMDGRVVQNGSPADLLRRPASPAVTAFIGDDQALHTLAFTKLSELATPRGRGNAAGSVVLPGEQSVLEGLRYLGTHGDRNADGIIVSDAQGQPSGYVGYNDLVVAVGETFVVDEGGAEAHALPDQ